ncbi:hypothetical protein [Vogesella sp. LIG4]|uniref:hypothetical protein n=1 Tax=Vogesella sp. LIG4 TaxID=1192162 RepID=UPI00081F907B|nr:hypothetical protein [Vogesella sp. LIG4]SCK16382.1 hypothetical protein PSELUDRAFT_1663 [Vogesella sp. LIG4]
MKKSGRITFLSTGVLLLCGGMISVAHAEETQWQKTHPRRNEVNQRLHKQNTRIDKLEAKDKISPAEARKLHREDKNIRQQERDMAKLNHGHLTKQEQKTLNQEENQVNQQIKSGS